MKREYWMLPSQWCVGFMVFILTLFILLNGFLPWNWGTGAKLLFGTFEIIGFIGFLTCKVALDKEYIEEMTRKD